ncbi:MAG: hypothetical protein GY765_41075 [bacterium]|nr:hypothetical protein [bacterium]
MSKKSILKFVIPVLMLSFLMAGSSVFADSPSACFARLGVLQNQSVSYDANWSYRIPMSLSQNCGVYWDTTILQSPSGMSFDGSKLYWTPGYAQRGQTFPVTVRCNVFYDDPPEEVVQTKTFYVTVIDCPTVNLSIECGFGTAGGNDLSAGVRVTNNSGCFVTTSGKVQLDGSLVHTWSNVAIAPHSSSLIYIKEYGGLKDCQTNYLYTWLTYTSITNVGSNSDTADSSSYEGNCSQ